MLFLREIKVLEARQRLEALVIPKRQALTRLQGLLAPLLQVTDMAFPQQLKMSIFRLFGYIRSGLLWLASGLKARCCVTDNSNR
jgi:hypothetical protein